LKTNRTLFHVSAILALTMALFVVVPPVHAGTIITVNTTADTEDEDAYCSLREAIDAADLDTNVGACPAGSGTDTIQFNISGGGVHVITLGSFLSTSEPVIIDGTTQPGYSGTPLIHLTGTASSLLNIGGETSVIKGLQFSNTYSGVEIRFGLTLWGDGAVVTDSYFNTDGTNSLGTTAGGGVEIRSSNNLIGTASHRNLFGGKRGILVFEGVLNMITGNYFGVQSSGSTALTGQVATDAAVLISPLDETCTNNLVRENVITGFGSGVMLHWPTHDNTVALNYIGLGADGVTAIGNGNGVYVAGSSGNIIGGSSAGDRNVISASNNTANIYVVAYGGHSPDHNLIRGNYIGTRADGMGVVTQADYGIFLSDGSATEIGGTTMGTGNLISGNDNGIGVFSGTSGTIIRGNWIGTDATGTGALGNVDGIYMYYGSANIGDPTTPGNNVISGNSSYGIYIGQSTGTTIYGNRIGMGAYDAGGIPNAYGVGLENDASATIARNWVAHSTLYGLYIGATSMIANNSLDNCFSSNTTGVANYTTVNAPLTNNWWGRPTGPTHSGNPSGTGDPVTDYVTYTSFLTKAPAACARTATDFEGDGRGDMGYFHPSTGLWGILQSGRSFSYTYPRYFSWGASGDVVTPADYDGDGIWDPTVRRPPTGGQSAAYLMLLSTTGYDFGLSLIVPAGWPGLGDTPVPGDYNADGIADPAIWRGNTGAWIIPLSPGFGSFAFYSWGVTGDKPIGADVDGDGRTDIGYWRSSTGVWGFLQSSAGYSYDSPLFFSWGASTDKPVMADYDGDGLADPAVLIPPAGGMSQAYRILQSSMAYSPLYSMTVPAGWPGLGDTPVPADYDGDHMADPGIWRSNTGVWIIPKSSGSYASYIFASWGASGDQVAR
jgi:CSLREA domain-containing protein